MQRQLRTAVRHARIDAQRARAFDGKIVGGDCGDTGIGDPFQQAFVMTVEHRALHFDRIVEFAVGVADQLAQSRMQAKDVALLDRDRVFLHHFFEHFVGDVGPRIAEMVPEIDQYRAALHAGLRHCRHRQCPGAGFTVKTAPLFIDEVKAVVRHLLRHTVAVGIKMRALVREAIPMRRILRIQKYRLVGTDIGKTRIGLAHVEVEINLALADHRMKLRRLAERVEHAAAGLVERMRQAEHFANLDFLQCRKPARRRQQVQPSALIVIAELAPVRTFGTLLPPSRHACLRRIDARITRA